MTHSFEKRNAHTVYEKDQVGAVQISDEVVAIIAALPATEVDGVVSMVGNVTNELVSKLGMKNLSKGVKVSVANSNISVELSLNIRYGCQIPEISARVQEKVKTAIETMTGMNVRDVNVRIAGVDVHE